MAVGIFNPIYLLGPPLLVLISLPLAFFAALTTVLAIVALTIRASILYFELATAILQNWLFKSKDKAVLTKPEFAHLSPTTEQVVTTHRRRYPSSAAVSSISSSQDLTAPKKPLSRRESWTSIVGAGSENRDYEGVGGWRITGEADDDALWISMNSRLELPAAAERKRKNHTRSLTSTSQRYSWSPEMRMSPVQSRARTPSVTMIDASQSQEYFDLQPHAHRPDIYTGAPAKSTEKLLRKKSMGASSTSSGNSAKLSKPTARPTSYG